MSEDEAEPFIVLEAPVLFEYGFEEYVDYILLITADEEIILDRVMARDNCSLEEAKARYGSQISQDRKREMSDICVDNSGSIEELEEKLERVFLHIKLQIICR